MPARARAGVGQAPQYQRWTSRRPLMWPRPSGHPGRVPAAGLAALVLLNSVVLTRFDHWDR
jgi:hypothetical protein